MPEKIVFKCPKCGATYPTPTPDWLCPKCGNPLNIFGKLPRRSSPLGEGNTPLVKQDKIFFKLEYLNPTGSFKDRGVSLTLQYIIKNMHCEYIIEDSSGNTGISTAAYSTAYRKKPVIYAPKTISPGKKAILGLLGAKIIVTKNREEAYEKARNEAKKKGRCYIGHMVNPIFLLGMKKIIEEIPSKKLAEITDIIIPVSSGTLLLGIYKGLLNEKEKGRISNLPKLWSVQTTSNNYLETYVKTHRTFHKEKGKTKLGDALVVKDPARKQEIIDAIKKTKGGNIVVDDEGIINGMKALYKKGFIIEPSSSVVWPAYTTLKENNLISGKTLIILTGSGLKYAEHLINISGPE